MQNYETDDCCSINTESPEITRELSLQASEIEHLEKKVAQLWSRLSTITRPLLQQEKEAGVVEKNINTEMGGCIHASNKKIYKISNSIDELISLLEI